MVLDALAAIAPEALAKVRVQGNLVNSRGQVMGELGWVNRIEGSFLEQQID